MSVSDNIQKINVYSLLTDPILTKKVKTLNKNSFTIVEVKKPEDIPNYECCDSVIVIEKNAYLKFKNRFVITDGSIIMVTNKEINLKDCIVNRVPKDLFLTRYLEEFIYWTTEKSHILLEKRKMQLRRYEVEKLITELKVVSRCSIFS